jgi:hypothetical protein
MMREVGYSPVRGRLLFPSMAVRFIAAKENNLQLNSPELAKEWNLVKNGELKPTDVAP